ncbi:immobilization antigen (macronuclear) [Tetrahymena thermophila SB210]|uniref:Immobilization antigen n=1 Tax=Tetrahymena thermophila (strain SB210) TaxID=312017 RepID=Q22YJ0_TETTS|nr:immobilization antigen [Tetrahymena thermophila SB210]EAR90295.1 immobilization antigen [Tetrahymena thermophila SB210]|eukprot:XP_001010540.1 immobilization antigen [Tetrahymena thermophila SB210]
MNKLLGILAIMSITASCVNATAGDDVNCGTANSAGGMASDCNGCGANSTIQGLFSASGASNCKVTDCMADPGSNLNGWMCKSCNNVSGANGAYYQGMIYFEGFQCVVQCDPGSAPDSNNICQAVGGGQVSCGTPSFPFSTDCIPCVKDASKQNLFSPNISPNCSVKDCTVDPGSDLNGWMCKSCNSNLKAHSVYSAGTFFSGSACVASCPTGYVADSNNNCQATNGGDVGCGTAGTAGGKATDCKGCGANSTIQGLFSVSGTPNCKVTDCTANPGSNLNGWMCKSCNGAFNAHTAYSAGKLLSGTACVASCPTGYAADSNNTCQATNGGDVDCGTAGTAGGKATDCNGCGSNSTIQGLFSVSGTPNCKVTDCTANPGSNLNGWMCKSCNGAFNAHTAYSAGKLLSGTACVASCPTGYAADSNNICQADPISTTSSYLLTLAFTILLLCLLI